jgi:hypothetical protein
MPTKETRPTVAEAERAPTKPAPAAKPEAPEAPPVPAKGIPAAPAIGGARTFEEREDLARHAAGLPPASKGE